VSLHVQMADIAHEGTAHMGGVGVEQCCKG
jgi:hypothetical protein